MPNSDEKEPVKELLAAYCSVKLLLTHRRDLQTTESDGLKEKRALQCILNHYEKEFQRLNGREVQFRRDILPISTEYERYKARIITECITT